MSKYKFKNFKDVQSAGSPATANSVYIDAVMKVCSFMIVIRKNAQVTRDSVYALRVSTNKTVTNLAKSSYDSITSEIKKVLGPLAAVTNPDIQAELLLVLNAVSK